MNEVSISLLNPIELRWTHSPGHAEEGPEVRPGLSGELHGVVVEDAKVAVRRDDGEVLSTRRERELVDGARRRRGIRGGLIRRGRGAARRRPDRPSVQGIPGFQPSQIWDAPLSYDLAVSYNPLVLGEELMHGEIAGYFGACLRCNPDGTSRRTQLSQERNKQPWQ